VVCVAELLASGTASYLYIDPLKVVGVLLAFALWVVLAQWVDRDTEAVNTFRTLWNLVMLGAGALATLVALFVPIFWIGYTVMWLVIVATVVVYVVHRNGLVKEDDKVMTLGHFKRLREQGFSGKKKTIEVKERVRLTGANRKVVEIPTDDAEKERYRLAQDLLFNALWKRAAITEVVPAGPQASRIVYHVDGVPQEGETLARPDAEVLVQYLKQLANLNLEERRKPQKSEIMAAIGGIKHKVYVRTDGSTAGEKLAIRILYKESEYKVPDLGFTAKQLEVVQATKEESKGLILLSSPHGNGLTTSIYSFTRNHDRFLQNVQTIEYEKELDLDNVTQNLFNPNETQTFAERLLKLVRSDPDIIVLPDLREREGATIASKAASEKQKVYTAVEAVDVFDALRKWIAMVGDKTLVAKSLLAVSNQRLVRVLCPTCKQAYKPDPQTMRKLNLPEDMVLYRPPEPQVDKRGVPVICQGCQGTGYVGRSGVFEWLTVDDQMREVIKRSASMAEIQNFALKRGNIGLQAAALQKVLEGITSIQEVGRVIRGEGAPAAAAAPRPAASPPPAAKPSPAVKPPEGSAPAAGGK
jgi:type II secretory ATPase GspE/PulE/Tfp pilus assembly ATPase PilB-like protein